MHVIHSHRHITLGVGGAQEDYAFHTNEQGFTVDEPVAEFDTALQLPPWFEER